MKVVTWHGLSAFYEPDELALMAELRRGCEPHELLLVHTFKALLQATVRDT